MAEQWEGEHGYAPKNHDHDDKYSPLNHTHANAIQLQYMPDFTRMVRMHKFLDGDEVWGWNPGTIYKINVPGYFYCEESKDVYTASSDASIRIAAHPGYLFRNPHVSTTGDAYPLVNHIDKRCILYRLVVHPWNTNFTTPIQPGINTYINFGDPTSVPSCQTWYFVPCKGVPDKYTEYFTRVGRCEFTLEPIYRTSNGPVEGAVEIGELHNHAASIFEGEWTDNFNEDGSLNESNVIRIMGSFICGRTYLGYGRDVLLTEDNFDEYIGHEYWDPSMYVSGPAVTYTDKGSYIEVYVHATPSMAAQTVYTRYPTIAESD